MATKQKSPGPRGAGDQNCGKNRQFAAAPEPIISPDAEEIIAAAAAQATPDASGAAERTRVGRDDMPEKSAPVWGLGQDCGRAEAPG